MKNSKFKIQNFTARAILSCLAIFHFSFFNCSAQLATNASAVITITNTFTTNGQSFRLFFDTDTNGYNYVFTNVTPVGFHFIAGTNPATKAATNIFTKLRSDWNNKLLVTYGSPTSIVLRTIGTKSLSLTNSTNWGTITLNNNTPTNQNTTVTASNFTARYSLTLNNVTIADWTALYTNGVGVPYNAGSSTNQSLYWPSFFGITTNGQWLTWTNLNGGLVTSNTVTTSVLVLNTNHLGTISSSIGRLTNGYMTNPILDRPFLTNGINYGNAFSSVGSGTTSESFGAGATATNTNANVFGRLAFSGSVRGLSVGYNAQTHTGADAIAIGSETGAFEVSATAVGSSAQANAPYSSAFGYSAIVNAAHTNSMALGAQAATTGTNQIVLGASAYTVVLPGKLIATNSAGVRFDFNTAATTTNTNSFSYAGIRSWDFKIYSNAFEILNLSSNVVFKQTQAGTTTVSNLAATGTATVTGLSTLGPTLVSSLTNSGASTLAGAVNIGGVLTSTNAVLYSPTFITPAFTNLTSSGSNRISGSFAFSRTNNTTLANGVNLVDPGDRTYLKISGPSAAYSIDKMTGGWDGRILILQKNDAFTMTIANESGSAGGAVSDRIHTGKNADVTVTNNPGFVQLIYDSATSRWGVMSKSD